MKRYLLFIVLMSSYCTFANMRSAERIVFAPTSSISVSGIDTRKTLEVARERLVIDCSYTNCQVNAVYIIYAKQDEPHLQFEFLLASEDSYLAETTASRSILVSINGQKSSAEIFGTDSYIDDKNDLSAMANKAVFQGVLAEGENFIQVTYEQNLTLLERDFGYFTHSRFVEHITYLLSPLKEWTLAKDFTLDIVVSTPSTRPDRDGWSLFRSRGIKCLPHDGVMNKKHGKITYTYHLNKDFPDILSCTVGDTDLIRL